MAGPSGFQEAFLVMERAGDRLLIVDAFPSGFQATDDADQRFQDTGRDYAIAQFLADIQDIADIVSQLDVETLSKVVNEPFKTLQLNGDDTDTTPQTLAGVPTARQAKNADNFLAWNLRAPLGGASGFNFTWRWAPDKTGTGSIEYDLSLRNLPSGSLVTDNAISTSGLVLSTPPGGGSWIEERIYENTITIVQPLESLEAFSINFKRLGSTDTFSQQTFVLSCAINYNPEDI